MGGMKTGSLKILSGKYFFNGFRIASSSFEILPEACMALFFPKTCHSIIKTKKGVLFDHSKLNIRPMASLIFGSLNLSIED